MADPRLERIAAAAATRGWQTEWAEADQRTELLIIPTISNTDQQGCLGLGVGVRLGGRSLSCWTWESWAGTLIEPLIDDGVAEGDALEALFPTVTDLEDCCRVFDRAALRYLAFMRRTVLTWPGLPGRLSEWADLEPVVTQGGRRHG